MNNFYKNKKILILANSNLFFKQHLYKIFEEYKYTSKIYFVTKKDYTFDLKSENLIHIPIIISRNPSFKDILSLLSYSILRIRIRPDISLSFTPKGSLINILTSILPGKTIHYFTGQRWTNFKGIKLFFFKAIDYFVIRFSHITYCDSFSQSNFISAKLKSKKPLVINYGSISGVDLEKYKPQKVNINSIRRDIKEKEKLEKLRDFLKHGEQSKERIIFGFIGRLHNDKGIDILIKAFIKNNKKFPSNKLILIGPIEIKKEYFISLTKNNDNILHLDFSKKPEIFYPEFDILLLPSLREGFGSVLIEAAACKVPTICTKIPGPLDFIKHQENGYFIKKNSEISLLKALNFSSKNKESILEMGELAYSVVLKKYRKKEVSEKFLNEFGIF